MPKVKVNVLIAHNQNDPAVIGGICFALNAAGYSPEVVGGGQDALRYFRTSLDFDLVIAEMELPDMTGVELIREIARDGIDVPAIVLTAQDCISLPIEELNSARNCRFLNIGAPASDIVSLANGVMEEKKARDQDRQLMVNMTKMKMEMERTADNLTKIGLALSAEKEFPKLLEKIVLNARGVTNADACILYLLDNSQLHFKIVQYASLSIHMGGRSDLPMRLAPVPLTPSHVAAHAAMTGQTVKIDDIYECDRFDFTETKNFDTILAYRSRSMLVVPMKNHENEVVGVWQLINAMDPRTKKLIPFTHIAETLAGAVASQAAVAVSNALLVDNMEDLFESFVRVMAMAIDETSPVTSGHIKRVADISLLLAMAVDERQDGRFADIHFTPERLHELRLAAWMHDIGKISTPREIVEKGKKLETVFDRIGLVDTRLRYVSRLVEIDGWRKRAELLETGAAKDAVEAAERGVEARLRELDSIREFLRQCNEPTEYLEDEKLERLKTISRLSYVDVDGREYRYVTDEELEYLSIRRGSITEKERAVMQNHANVTLKMLNNIPFTKKLKNIPQFASTHHERPNGTGYPLGLKGDEIPFEGRLMAVADIAEALTAADRPYKKQMPLATAHSIMRKMAERGDLDPDLVELFISQKIYEQYLEAGNSGNSSGTPASL